VVLKFSLLGALLGLCLSPSGHAAEGGSAKDSVQAAKKAEGDKKDQKVRDFYETLDDVMADFEYDLKNQQVQGLQNLSIRNIVVSENVPNSFKSHLELIVNEKIMQNTKTQIIECLPCRSKKATLSGSNLVITSPDSDPAHLARLAKQTGILHFMDIAFSYQPTGLMVSMVVSDADNGTITWSRSYNSESSRAAAFRRGVDFNQIDKARRSGEYEPTVLYRPTIYFMYEKDVTSYTGCLGIGVRIAERYDNRKREVGFELTYLLSIGSLTGASAAAGNPATLFGGFNISLQFVHAWNLIGELENFNQARGSIFAGIGGMYASGYLAGLVRAGYEHRMGKHWSISGLVGFRPDATAIIQGASSQVSGFEFGISVSGIFF
jgi:hypothetical protein